MSLLISKEPIARGSEVCSLSETERINTYNYKEGVIFPAGLLVNGDEFIVSCGVNDSSCVLLKIKPEALHL